LVKSPSTGDDILHAQTLEFYSSLKILDPTQKLDGITVKLFDNLITSIKGANLRNTIMDSAIDIYISKYRLNVTAFDARALLGQCIYVLATAK